MILYRNSRNRRPKGSDSYIHGSDLTLQLDCGILKPTEVVRDLGVLLDTELSMTQWSSTLHGLQVTVSTICAGYTTDQTSRWRRCHITSQLISAFVLSRLDYCNSLLAGIPRTSVEPLQRVQNAAARLVLNLSLRDDVTPVTCRNLDSRNLDIQIWTIKIWTLKIWNACPNANAYRPGK